MVFETLPLLYKQIASIVLVIILIYLGFKIIKRLVGVAILVGVALALLYYFGWLF
ncbi:MAG: hypothetical protein KJ906_03110 [Nanoarchaeota archaeon]|nr:hypothetical protein [Nanoarchaeota archaeon]